MSNFFASSAVSITATGFSAATGAASARTAIPNSTSGAPRYIRVAARNECYFKIGDSTVVATTNDILVQPADCVIIQVSGATHIAYIQGTAAGQINVTPLENG